LHEYNYSPNSKQNNTITVKWYLITKLTDSPFEWDEMNGSKLIYENYYKPTYRKAIIMNFKTLWETIFRGNASVVNGQFEFSFIVPQDIRIPVGNGKISFYAKTTGAILEDETGLSYGYNDPNLG
jgi:hypothetical protein